MRGRLYVHLFKIMLTTGLLLDCVSTSGANFDVYQSRRWSRLLLGLRQAIQHGTVAQLNGFLRASPDMGFPGKILHIFILVRLQTDFDNAVDQWTGERSGYTGTVDLSVAIWRLVMMVYLSKMVFWLEEAVPDNYGYFYKLTLEQTTCCIKYYGK
ncbi:MAG: hypothetical protein R2813_07150 [Flavobacteriales bacterium]